MKHSIQFTIFAFLVMLCLASEVAGQGRPPLPNSGRSTGIDSTRSEKGTGLFGRREIKPDTFDTQYFFLDNPFLIEDNLDTLLGNNFSQPDPAFHGDYAYANLGNLGSPLSPLVYQSNLKSGLNIGFNSFDNYYFQKEELQFFRLKSAFTNATYSQGKTQDDQHLRVIFAKEFGKSLSFTIHHHRINHVGVFPNQLARNYALNTGFWYHHPKGKYQAFLTLTSNSTIHLENGGIDTSSLRIGNIAQAGTIPVLLSQDTTRYQMRSGGIVQYYHLRSPVPKKNKDTTILSQFPMHSNDTLGVGKIDSTIIDSVDLEKNDALILEEKNVVDSFSLDSIIQLDTTQFFPSDSIQIDSLLSDSIIVSKDSLAVKKRKRKKVIQYYDPNILIPQRRQISIGHELNIFRGFYKYADLDADSSFYKNLYVYNQGLQYRIAHSGMENSFFISTASMKDLRTGKTQQPRDYLKAGIKHSYNKYSQRNDTNRVHNISLFGVGDLLLFEKLNLQANAGLYLTGYNAGDFYLNGTIGLEIPNIGSLKILALSQAYAPSIMQQRLLISGVDIWNNDFQKTIETKIGGNILIEKTGTNIGVNFQLLDSYIYHDSLGIARQYDDIFALPQLVIHQPINIGIFHMENTVVFQRSNDDILSLPNIFSKHNLFLEGKIFKKKMLVRFGAEGIFHSNYRTRRYQPLIGQFYNSNKVFKYYPQFDPYISIKRGGFRFYVRAQNLSSMIVNGQIQDQLNSEINANYGYRIPNYPIANRVIRFGISWMLLN